MRPRSPYPALVAATLLALALLAARIHRTHGMAYYFLAYNLLLAWIPIGFEALTRRLWRSRSALALPAGLAWWIFFPNAFYLVTDFVHLHPRDGAPFWFDIALVSAFAWSGTLLALSSLGRMHAIVREARGALPGWAFAAFACASAGFGIWLGRVQRWNSWDAVLHPGLVAGDAAHALAHPFRVPSAWGVTAAFGGLLGVIYLAFLTLPAHGARART